MSNQKRRITRPNNEEATMPTETAEHAHSHVETDSGLAVCRCGMEWDDEQGICERQEDVLAAAQDVPRDVRYSIGGAIENGEVALYADHGGQEWHDGQGRKAIEPHCPNCGHDRSRRRITNPEEAICLLLGIDYAEYRSAREARMTAALDAIREAADA